MSKNTLFSFLSRGNITLFLKKIAGMRDLIGHGYDSFDHESISEGFLSKSNVEQWPIFCCCDMYCITEICVTI